MGRAHVYEWQMNHVTAPEEKKRMLRELDFAYRQSIALNPYDVEKVKRYVSVSAATAASRPYGGASKQLTPKNSRALVALRFAFPNHNHAPAKVLAPSDHSRRFGYFISASR